jgi:hypothetical protein
MTDLPGIPQTDPPVNPDLVIDMSEPIERQPGEFDAALAAAGSVAGAPGTIRDKPIPEVHQLPDAEGRLLSEDELPVPGVHYVEWESRDWGVVRGCQLPEAEYVRQQIEQTRLTVDRFGIRDEVLTPKGTYVSVPREHRLDRAAAHARWRYRGYLAGEVSSL